MTVGQLIEALLDMDEDADAALSIADEFYLPLDFVREELQLPFRVFLVCHENLAEPVKKE